MAYDELRYDSVRQKSIHNTFQRTEGIYDQIVYWRVRSLEADIHTSHLFDEIIFLFALKSKRGQINSLVIPISNQFRYSLSDRRRLLQSVTAKTNR